MRACNRFELGRGLTSRRGADRRGLAIQSGRVQVALIAILFLIATGFFVARSTARAEENRPVLMYVYAFGQEFLPDLFYYEIGGIVTNVTVRNNLGIRIVGSPFSTDTTTVGDGSFMKSYIIEGTEGFGALCMVAVIENDDAISDWVFVET